MNKTIYEETHIVAYGLDALVKPLLNKVAALEAYEVIQSEGGFAKPQSLFLNIAYFSLKESVVLGLLNMMDRDISNGARGRVNCSLGELRQLLKDDRYSDFRNEKRNHIIETIDKINGCSVHQNLKSLRNKLVAHNDLVSMFDTKEISYIETCQLKNLIFEIYDVIDLTFQLCVGASAKHKSYGMLMAEYKESLTACAWTPYPQ